MNSGLPSSIAAMRFGATTLEVESATFFAEGTANDQSDFLTAVAIPEADPLLGSFENPIQLEEGQTFSGRVGFWRVGVFSRAEPQRGRC